MVAGQWTGLCVVQWVGKNTGRYSQKHYIFYARPLVVCKSWGIGLVHNFPLGAEKQNGMYFCNTH